MNRTQIEIYAPGMAAMTILGVPSLIVFLFLQRYSMEGVNLHRPQGVDRPGSKPGMCGIAGRLGVGVTPWDNRKVALDGAIRVWCRRQTDVWLGALRPEMDATPLGNEWTTVEHALTYLTRADQVPHRGEAEAILLEVIPKDVDRILDLGTGDGRLLGLLRIDRGDAAGVAIDFSPTMLAKARERFHGDTKVQVLEHDLEKPLPDMGRFDAIVSSFAIHHCTDQRKQSLYSEIYAALSPGGVFCNLEHVAPTSDELHGQFLEAFGITEADEDPSNKLVGLETQLHWLREMGFDDVNCHWQWLELALFSGTRKV